MKANPVAAERPSCSAKMRRGGSQLTLRQAAGIANPLNDRWYLRLSCAFALHSWRDRRLAAALAQILCVAEMNGAGLPLGILGALSNACPRTSLPIACTPLIALSLLSEFLMPKADWRFTSKQTKLRRVFELM
jgi:hypothetical protein